MKKFFSYFGLFSLLLVSFFYTEKTVNVVKEYDEVMIKLKEYAVKNKKEPINAYISGNSIIPGISGYQIDINKSYNKMKRYGKFERSLVEYENIKPQISIDDNIDKYIVSGNPENRSVVLLFEVSDNDINSIIKILDKNKVKGNFFIDGIWLEKNSKNIESIIKSGHIIGNLDSDVNNFLWIDTIIKKVGKQKNGYCYFENESNELLNFCSLYGNYSIKPIKVTNNLYKEVKEKLISGSIFSFKVDKNNINELDIVISYIKSKGFIIQNLNDFIKE